MLGSAFDKQTTMVTVFLAWLLFLRPHASTRTTQKKRPSSNGGLGHLPAFCRSATRTAKLAVSTETRLIRTLRKTYGASFGQKARRLAKIFER
jgi:hypothetical protein